MDFTESNVSISVGGNVLYPHGENVGLASPLKIEAVWNGEIENLPDSSSPLILARANTVKRVMLEMSGSGDMPDRLETMLDHIAKFGSANGTMIVSFPNVPTVVLKGSHSQINTWQITDTPGVSILGLGIVSGLYLSLPVTFPVLDSGHVEIVNDGSVKWMEFVFTLPPGWSGAAEYAYFNDLSNPSLIIWIEHTQDLITWSQGVFSDAPGDWVTDLFGYTTCRARSAYPQDAAEKVVDISVYFGLNHIDGVYALLISLTIDSATVSLPHFPYDINDGTQRALLCSDLASAGYVGASMSLDTSNSWVLHIPDVPLIAGFGSQVLFSTNNRYYYDVYGLLQVTNQAGIIYSNQRPAGIPFDILVRQFCRIKCAAIP
jgi:hypothetical protein